MKSLMDNDDKKKKKFRSKLISEKKNCIFLKLEDRRRCYEDNVIVNGQALKARVAACHALSTHVRGVPVSIPEASLS